ncbi:MAG TPA: protein kinase, partial [Polyangiales bacterium]|nr:protein kinase [Polyangiales bacterium]
MAGRQAAVRDAPLIAERYELLGELGRGGMAVVYRVRDGSSGRELALKQLAVREGQPHAEDARRLFEREFHTLVQLAHPRIIEVYEYGIDAEGPYYTMELLDGGDLRELAPLDWREACKVALDVCSSLALLHSRGLVHRDVSTRNVRYTHSRTAKLIDFGAMMPMGPCTQLVGTAPFVAPEVVNHSNVDARTDLFSLGATFYSALTGRTAYRARHFSELGEVWRTPPPPPSSVRAEIPAALDELVLSLLAVDPGARPRSAAEVMARLTEIAGLPPDESLDVRQAYLFSPALVGRSAVLRRFERYFLRARRGRGGSVLLTGPAGVGRSRVLDACVLRAKVAGAMVLRCNAANAEPVAWGVAQALLDQLHEARRDVDFTPLSSALGAPSAAPPPPPVSGVPAAGQQAGAAAAGSRDSLAPAASVQPAPRLGELVRAGTDPRALGLALRDFLRVLARKQILVLAVDDLDRADEASSALLAALALIAPTAQLLCVATHGGHATGPVLVGLELFAEHAAQIELERLSEAQSETLLRHVFGDVPHLATLNAAIFAVADGRPRALLEHAQHLVDDGTIGYENGSWKLPATLDRNALPVAIAAGLRQRVERLSELARELGRCHALSGFDRFTRDDYLALSVTRDGHAVDAALDELVQARIASSDGQVFALAHDGWLAPLTAGVHGEERARLHGTLAALCDQRGRHPLLAVRHLFDAEQASAALDRLGAYLREVGDDINRMALSLPLSYEQLGVLLQRAQQASVAAGRPQRELFDICSWVMMLSVTTHDALYWSVAPALRARIEQDSGLSHLQTLDPALPLVQRMQIAFGHAFEVYNATPEVERVYRPDEALKMMVYYAGVSIAIGTRSNDELLLESIPGMLEPFEALSPLLHTFWQNAVATIESSCRTQWQVARERWLAVFDRLQRAEGVDAYYVATVGRAVAFGLASIELRVGIPPSSRWLELLEADPLQCVSAAYLRRAWRIQLGDAEGAERFRRQAELLAVQTGLRSLFSSHLPLELAAYAYAYDYQGLREARQRIEPFAERSRWWVPYRALADGYLLRTRGNVPAALAAFEQVLSECEASRAEGRPRLNVWLLATAAQIEALLEQGRADEAHRTGLAALERCEQLGIDRVADPLRRAHALCEAKLGRYTDAAERLDRV